MNIKESNNQSSQSKGTKYWFFYAVVFLIFYLVSQFGADIFKGLFHSEKTSEEMLNQKWVKESYGNFGLVIETPAKLHKSDLTIPNDVKHLVEQIETYGYKSGNGFEILINSVKYSPEIAQANLQEAMNSAVNEMKQYKDVIDFDYSENSFFKKDIPGIIQRGSFKQNNVQQSFIQLGLTKGLVLWQVLLICKATDEAGKVASNRIIESIEIDESKI